MPLSSRISRLEFISPRAPAKTGLPLGKNRCACSNRCQASSNGLRPIAPRSQPHRGDFSGPDTLRELQLRRHAPTCCGAFSAWSVSEKCGRPKGSYGKEPGSSPDTRGPAPRSPNPPTLAEGDVRAGLRRRIMYGRSVTRGVGDGSGRPSHNPSGERGDPWARAAALAGGAVEGAFRISRGLNRRSVGI